MNKSKGAGCLIHDTYPIWSSVNAVTQQYPWLDSDITCDVCIVGAGLTGALCALRFAQTGASVALLTAHQVGYGATSDASPALQYDAGMRVLELKRDFGLENAMELLQIGAQSLDSMEKLCASFDDDCGFKRCDAMIFTDDERDTDLLNREYLIRRHSGFDCTFVNRAAARDVFSFPIEGAIISKGLGAIFDPYRMTVQCIKQAVQLGAQVYENTKVEQVDSTGETIIMDTSTRKSVFCQRAVFAIGEAGADILECFGKKRTTFYVASEPVQDSSEWPGGCIIRTWSMPALSISPTPDSRVFSSGLDTSVVDREGKVYNAFHMPALVNRRFEELEAAARESFPGITMPAFEFACASQYHDTFDHLPVIGEHGAHNNCYFAMCPSNGAQIFSDFAARSIADYYMGVSIPCAKLFSPERTARRNHR